MTIMKIWTDLEVQCDRSLQAIKSVNKAEYLQSDEMKTIRDMVVQQAFVSVFSAWEHFLEDTTVAYALGAPSNRGYCLTRYIFPLDSDHAKQLIKGPAVYPDWSKMDTVKQLTRAFFEDGQPYKIALNGFSSTFKDMKKVRNIIVHNSINSRNEFDSLVRTALRASRVGITPVEFLLSRKNSNPYFYEIYIQQIRNAGRIIAEYSR